MTCFEVRLRQERRNEPSGLRSQAGNMQAEAANDHVRWASRWPFLVY